MRSKRQHPWLGFDPCLVLAALGFVLLDGPAAGVVSLLAVLAFLGACIHALRGADPESVRQSERTNLTGWFM